MQEYLAVFYALNLFHFLQFEIEKINKAKVEKSM